MPSFLKLKNNSKFVNKSMFRIVNRNTTTKMRWNSSTSSLDVATYVNDNIVDFTWYATVNTSAIEMTIAQIKLTPNHQLGSNNDVTSLSFSKDSNDSPLVNNQLTNYYAHVVIEDAANNLSICVSNLVTVPDTTPPTYTILDFAHRYNNTTGQDYLQLKLRGQDNSSSKVTFKVVIAKADDNTIFDQQYLLENGDEGDWRDGGSFRIHKIYTDYTGELLIAGQDYVAHFIANDRTNPRNYTGTVITNSVTF